MNNKEYKDYHVLDEEIEDLEVPQENQETKNATKVEDIEHKEDIEAGVENTVSDIIDVEAVELHDEAAVNNKAHIVVYTPVLTEEENMEDTYQETYKNDKEGDKESLYEEDVNKAEEHKQAEYKNEQPEMIKDTSFTSYVQADKKRERSFFAKWGIRFAKLILFIMLLPVIGIIGGGVIGIAGGVTFGILTCIGGGVFILGATCFVATQINAMIVALGVSVGITAISFGLIVLILCIMLIKKVVKSIRKRKMIKRNKEVR